MKYYIFLFTQLHEEVNSLKQQVTTLHQELEESRRELAKAQGAKDQLTARLSGDVTSLNHQLKEAREDHRAEVRAKEKDIELLRRQVREERRYM